MGLEGHDAEETGHFDQHEIKVPVLVLKQIFVVSVLTHHGELSLALNLLDCDLNCAQLGSYFANLLICGGHVIGAAQDFLSGLFLRLPFDNIALTISIDVVLNLFLLVFVGVEGQRHSQV